MFRAEKDSDSHCVETSQLLVLYVITAADV